MSSGNDGTDLVRPGLHYSVPRGWLNDPNGLVYRDGDYHLFYQYHPHDIVWGPMHWGHAVSRDLLQWQTLPTALVPDAEGQIFSGSAVVDTENSAGFGRNSLVAIYTQHREGRQAQSLAVSGDGGYSWQPYAGNPVLLPPDGIIDFRDPKVMRYAAADGSAYWIMVLAVGRQIWFYRSTDLQRWTKTGEFGGYGAAGGVWECPDLFELAVDGGPQHRWVLLVSVAEGAPAGGSGQQYFIGEFDGARFTTTDDAARVRWLDYGADCYAMQSWYGAPAGRRVALGWLNNWGYARQTPATDWRGMMTLPRDLALRSDAGDVQLVQQPAAELAVRRRPSTLWTPVPSYVDDRQRVAAPESAWELLVGFRLIAGVSTSCGVRIDGGPGEAVIIRYDVAAGELTVDRRKAGALFADEAPQRCPLHPRDGMVALQVIVDRQTLEVFADGGRTVLTNQIFLHARMHRVSLLSEGDVILRSLGVNELAEH